MANIAKLDQLAEWLTAHPDEHDQSSWIRGEVNAKGAICDTTACAAGWTCVLNQEPIKIRLIYPSCSCSLCQENSGWIDFTLESGEQFADRAQEILDLTYEERYDLFYSAATLEEVLWTIENIKNGNYRVDE